MRTILVLGSSLLGLVAVSACATTNDDGAAQSESALGSCPGAQLPGFDCTTPGQLCTKGCYAKDTRAQAFAAFTIGGLVVDSRSVPYSPQLSLDNVQVYGCNVWNFQRLLDRDNIRNPANFEEAYRQGFEIRFKKSIAGAFLPNAPSDFEHEISVYADNFRGPGKYPADLRYVASDEARAAGEIFAKASACTLDVVADGAGGLKGTLGCDPVAAKSGATVTVTGAFACGGDAMSPIFSKLP